MLRIDRRLITNFDFAGFFLILTITFIGLLTVFSATTSGSERFSYYFIKQLEGTFAALGIYLLFCSIGYEKIERWSYFLFFFVVILLGITLIKGSIGMGAQRWISIAGVKFQPSEIVKILFPAFFSYFLTTEKRPFTTNTFKPLIIILCVVTVLVLKQPDLGTAIIILVSGCILLMVAGLNKKFFIIAAMVIALAAPLCWSLLKPYQKNRIIVFMGGGDSHKERYHIEQSKIAIGSGRFFGKGYLQGTQNHLCFLPERRTDFIFSVFAEEFGFVGCCILIMLFFLLFYHLYSVIVTVTDKNAQLLMYGLITPLVLSTGINIGMVLGLTPIVGIPLPFMSYGLTHTLITFAMCGWINSILMRRGSMVKKTEG